MAGCQGLLAWIACGSRAVFFVSFSGGRILPVRTIDRISMPRLRHDKGNDLFCERSVSAFLCFEPISGIMACLVYLFFL